MSKRGAINTLVGLAILVIVFAVIFLGALPGFERKLEAAGTKSTCEWSILLSAVSKAGTLGIAEGIPSGCKAKVRTIMPRDLDLRFARNRIESYQKQPNVYDLKNMYFSSVEEHKLKEFALDKIVADELVDCWDKVFKGRMKLFDQWWHFYTPFWSGDKPPEGTGEAADSFIGQFHRAPVNCIMCARIKFSPELIAMFRTPPLDTSVDSLMEFMENNPAPRTNVPYLKYVYDGQTGTDLFKPKYRFDIGVQGIAILYERINVLQAQRLAEAPLSWLGVLDQSSDLTYLKLVKYSQDEIVSSQGEGCTLLID